METALLSLLLNSLARITSARMCPCNNGSITEVREADRRTKDTGSPLCAGSTGEDPLTHTAGWEHGHQVMKIICWCDTCGWRRLPGMSPFRFPFSYSIAPEWKINLDRQNRRELGSEAPSSREGPRGQMVILPWGRGLSFHPGSWWSLRAAVLQHHARQDSEGSRAIRP